LRANYNEIRMIIRPNLLFVIILVSFFFTACAHFTRDKAGIGELPKRPPITEEFNYKINVEQNCSIMSISLPDIPARICLELRLPDVGCIIGMKWKEGRYLNFCSRLLPGRKNSGLKGDYYWDDEKRTAEVYFSLPCVYFLRRHFETKLEMLAITKSRQLVKLVKNVTYNWQEINSQTMTDEIRAVIKREIDRLDVKRISLELRHQLEQLGLLKIAE